MSTHDRAVRRWGWLSASILFLLVVAPAVAEEPNAPAPDKAKKHYRWGAGWDEGLALRAKLADGWGLGLRVNPDLIDPESSGTDSSDNDSDWLCSGVRFCGSGTKSHSSQSANGDVRTFSASLMAYREKRLGKWLAVGPYLALNYNRQRETQTETYESESQSQTVYPPTPLITSPPYTSRSRTTRTHWQRTMGVELGVRPTFQFHERFVLETRFGLEWAHTKWNESSETHSENDGGGPIYPVYDDKTAASSSPDIVSPLPTTKGESDSKSARKGTEKRLHAVGERLGPGAQLRFIVLF
jgi:hypothetical protein